MSDSLSGTPRSDAAHSDALVFTSWRLWFALPPLAVIVMWRSRRGASAPFWPADVPQLQWIALLVGAGAFFLAGAKERALAAR